MKNFITIFLILTSGNLIAQNSESTSSETIYTFVDQPPEFKGGIDALYSYLSKHINYPDEAIKNCIEGTVYMQFIVEKDGSLNDIIIKKGIGYGCDEEAQRVISNMPKWKPGKAGDKKVRVYLALPIKFEISDECTPAPENNK